MLTMHTLHSFPLRKGHMNSNQFHSGSNLSGGFLILEGYSFLADGVAAAEISVEGRASSVLSGDTSASPDYGGT